MKQVRDRDGAAGRDRIDDELCEGGSTIACTEPQMVMLVANTRG